MKIKKVDPETFEFLLNIYSLAFTGQIQTDDPTDRKFEIDGDVYSFADKPITRAMSAVSKELFDLGLNEFSDQAAYQMRLWAFPEIVKTSSFKRFVKAGEKDTYIHKSLIHAMAICKFKRDMSVDKKDLLAIANRNFK